MLALKKKKKSSVFKTVSHFRELLQSILLLSHARSEKNQKLQSKLLAHGTRFIVLDTFLPFLYSFVSGSFMCFKLSYDAEKLISVSHTHYYQ